MMDNWVIIRTLSGVTFLSKDTKNEENAVTKETERPIVKETERRLVTPKAEQMPKTATKIWLLPHIWEDKKESVLGCAILEFFYILHLL